MRFDLAELLKQNADVVAEETLQRIDINLIDEDSRNFYSMTGIEELAASIELNGLMDPIRVREHPDKLGHFIVVSGHRRRAACLKLQHEGNRRFDSINCIVEHGGSEAMQELRLIHANSCTRQLSSADLQKQAERVTELLYKLKSEGVEFPGRMANHVAEACNISASKLKRLNAIKNNLTADFYHCYEAGTLNETAAYALSRLPVEVQEDLARHKKIMNMAQAQNGIVAYKVENTIDSSSDYNNPAIICKHDKAQCCHTMDRYAANIASGYWSCHGGCCCKCAHLDECCYPCKHGKEQRKTEAEKRKAEKIEAETDRKVQQALTDNMRKIRHLAQVFRLVDLADRAGLADDVLLPAGWQRIKVGDVRRLAQVGFPAGTHFYNQNYTLLDQRLDGMEKLAEVLHCTVGELAGETVSSPDPGNKWRSMETWEPGDKSCWIILRHRNGDPEAAYWDAGKQDLMWFPGDTCVLDTLSFTGWAPAPVD